MARFKSITRLKWALMGKKHRKLDSIDGDGDEEKAKIVNECQSNPPLDNPEETHFSYSQTTHLTINRPINSLLRSFRRKIDGRKRKKGNELDLSPQTIVSSPLFTDQSSSKDVDLFNEKPLVKIPENLLDFSPDINLEIPYADEVNSDGGDMIDGMVPVRQFTLSKNFYDPSPPRTSPPPPPISSNHFNPHPNHLNYHSSYLPVKEPLNSSLYRLKSIYSHELIKLNDHGWYWGPISRSEADHRLTVAGDGSFLVRDSSDDRHLLSLSFRSNGRTYHTRIEHANGLFSFTSRPLLPTAHSSVITLIEESMRKSKAGIFCYSSGRSPNNQKVPVRLIKPVSRFHSVLSLQFLCRFTLRLYNLPKLPPTTPSYKYFLDQNHYQ